VHLEASLGALIKRRFDRLKPASTRVLQACAVLAKHSTLTRLSELLQIGNSEFIDSLDELERHALIETSGQFVQCRHDLIATAALAPLGSGSRRLLHLSAAKVLDKELSDGSAPGLLWDIAEHWFQGANNARAVTAMRACAAEAMQLGSPVEAARMLHRALELPLTIEVKRQVLAEYVDVLERGCLWNDLVPALQELLRLDGAAGEPRIQHGRKLLLMDAQRKCGDDPEAILAKLVDYVKPEYPASDRVRAGTIALKICDNLSRPDVADRVFSDLEPALEDPSVPAEIRLECGLIYHCSVGDLSLAAEDGRALILHARQQRNETLLLKALHYGGLALRLAGFESEGREVLAEGYALSASRDIALAASAIADELSGVALVAGDLEEAKRWADRGVAWGRKAAVAFGTPGAIMQAIAVALCLGDDDEAQALLGECEQNSLTISRYPRANVTVVGLRLYLAWKRTGKIPGGHQLDELLGLFRITRCLSLQDFPAYMTWELLRASGREVEAGALVHDYVNIHRRDRTPLLPEIRAALVYSTEAVPRRRGRVGELPDDIRFRFRRRR
jgi:hypothetical protein